MSKVIRPPIIREGKFFFPEVCEDDFSNLLLPLRQSWVVHGERLGWIDMDATFEWFAKGDCTLYELYLITKMLDAVHRKGLKTKRYRKMIAEEQELNRQIVAICKRLKARERAREEANEIASNNVVQLKN
jgi:hypothetical protein